MDQLTIWLSRSTKWYHATDIVVLTLVANSIYVAPSTLLAWFFAAYLLLLALRMSVWDKLWKLHVEERQKQPDADFWTTTWAFNTFFTWPILLIVAVLPALASAVLHDPFHLFRAVWAHVLVARESVQEMVAKWGFPAFLAIMVVPWALMATFLPVDRPM